MNPPQKSIGSHEEDEGDSEIVNHRNAQKEEQLQQQQQHQAHGSRQEEIPTPTISNRISPSQNGDDPHELLLPPPAAAASCAAQSSDGGGEGEVVQLLPRFSSADQAPICMDRLNVKVVYDGQQHVLVQQPKISNSSSTTTTGVSCLEANESRSHRDGSGVVAVELLVRSAIAMAPVIKKKLKHVMLQQRRNQLGAAVVSPESCSQQQECCSITNSSSTAEIVGVHVVGQSSKRSASCSSGNPLSYSGGETKNSIVVVQGIPNFGQTCFLNSVLQSLASLEPFTAYLEHMCDIRSERQRFLLLDEFDNDDGKGSRAAASLCETLRDVLASVNGQRSSSTAPDPRPVLQAVGRKHEQFQARYNGATTNSAEQQDAQELLQAALGMVADEGLFQWTHGAAESSIFCASFRQKACHNDNHGDVNSDSCCLTAMAGIRERRQKLKGEQPHFDQEHKPPDGTHSPKSIMCASTEQASDEDDDKDNEYIPEEKKQEDFDVRVPLAQAADPNSKESFLLDHLRHAVATIDAEGGSPSAAEGGNTDFSESTADHLESMTKAMQIVMTTTSSITTSPLSGWVGSALMCHTCRRVRSIQSTPFLDLGVVPTAVSHYILSRRRRHPGEPPQKPGGREPACRLEECLEEYTSIERVHDVECKYCTIQAEIDESESEKEMLEQTIRGLVSRRAKQNPSAHDSPHSASHDEFKHLQDELSIVELRLELLRRTSPDDDGPLPMVDDGIGSAEQHAELKRSDAFKCLLLTRLPAVLTIHVQRRYYDQTTNRTSKTMQHVIFPEILDVAPYCAYGGSVNPQFPFAGTVNHRSNSEYGEQTTLKSPIQYRLMSVIEHQGGPFSGHYVCYRRDPATGGWLWTSDDKLVRCDWARVQQCQAYMLFYEAM